MSTLKRLSDDDVRAVFACLRNYQRPPEHLSFRIVPVGPRGLKLSPPSHEFDDGLYVLLRPMRTKSSKKVGGTSNGSRLLPHPRGDSYMGVSVGERPQDRVPELLAHLIMAEHELPPETCPWSLSGPQFPTPTNIQQRYCYPKGDKAYSSRKGGALWTMCDETGKEDTEYRLLHVCLSAKRAANKGVDLSQEEKDLVYQRQQQATAGGASGAAIISPKSKKARFSRKSVVIHRGTQGRQPSRYRQQCDASAHNTVSTSTPTTSPPHVGAAMLVSSPSSLSPLGFNGLTTPWSISPSSSHYRDPHGGSGQLHTPLFHRSSSLAHPSHPSFGSLYTQPLASGHPAPFVTPLQGTPRRHHYDPYSHRRTAFDDDDDDDHHQHQPTVTNDDRHFHEGHFHVSGDLHLPEDDRRHNIRQSPLRRNELFLDDPRADPFWDGHEVNDAGEDGHDNIRLPHQRRRDGASIENSRAAAAAMLSKSEGSDDDDSMSGDPFGGISIPTSDDGGADHSSHRFHRRSSSSSTSSTFSAASAAVIGVTLDRDESVVEPDDASPSRSLTRRLSHIQRSLRDVVLSHPPSLRGKLTSMVVHWAVRLKLDPLADVKDEDDNDDVVQDTTMAGAGSDQTMLPMSGPATLALPSTFLSANTSSSAADSVNSCGNHQPSGNDSGMDELDADVTGDRIDCAMSVVAV